MADIDVDLTALETAQLRVADALAAFRSADRVGDDLADLTGEPRLAGRVRDFAGNWDHNRGKLEEQLEAVGDWLEAIRETLTELDEDMG
ncbi:hypothetical protein [Microbacterium jejuense]|uniref:hypothetical protein n=1 Tax=Microbacterium jejuense TaxID=1263637 RepID=UPI0027E2468E|nr:hypothetical protein [Microbacterium jejuense]